MMDELSAELYNVAWIAPLEIEAQAALHMLDNRHQGRFNIGRGDDYVFQAGDINGHNVIIATLPAGQEYGTGSAAALASQVKKFFPNLWFGLLVGIAAGLPNLSKHPPLDIRLGDVLVGLSKGNSAGLVAYDLGKETGAHGFQLLQVGSVLANTETVVRSAIGSIKMRAPYDADVFLPIYETVKDKYHPNGTFIDPGQEKDRLYQLGQDGVEKLVERDRRPNSNRTRVWYGAIGSGDKLVKNICKRNELRDKYNLIGLEMEAAGIMNRIPVGVIRGVCDYADEHKNKEWQPYAAAMAASYAKAIFYEIGRGKAVSKWDGKRSKSWKGLVLCELPSKSDRFFGREKELSALKSHLETPNSNRNGVVLCGISGSGKTQLVHEYVSRERENFSAILWLNADTEMGAEQSFGACASRICHEIPEFRDHEKHISSRDIVFDWLRMTPHRNWLVVVDGADDLILNRRFLESLSRLNHGAICVTSTHPGTARAVHFQQISVERLDPAASQSLILWRALGSEQNPGNEGNESARQAVKVLHGFVLGIELAGILIHEGIISLDSFPSKFEARYQQLASFEVDPGMWIWSKSSSISSMFSDLYESLVAKNASAGLLLTLCSVYGPWEIPSSLLLGLELYDANSSKSVDHWRRLQTLLHDEVGFNMAVYELYRVFLAKRKQDSNGNLLTISLHGSVCQWRFATIGDQKAEWIMKASCGLARFIGSISGHQQKTTEGKAVNIAYRFFHLSDHCLNTIRTHIPNHELEAPDGKYAAQYFEICSYMAHIYLSIGKYEISKTLFSAATEYILITEGGKPNDIEFLRLLRGFASSCKKTADLTKAEEILRSAVEIADSLCGHLSDEVIEFDSQLKAVRERIAIDLDHRKRALVASTGGKLREPAIPRLDSRYDSTLSTRPPQNISSSETNITHRAVAWPHVQLQLGPDGEEEGDFVGPACEEGLLLQPKPPSYLDVMQLSRNMYQRPGPVCCHCCTTPRL